MGIPLAVWLTQLYKLFAIIAKLLVQHWAFSNTSPAPSMLQKLPRQSHCRQLSGQTVEPVLYTGFLYPVNYLVILLPIFFLKFCLGFIESVLLNFSLLLYDSFNTFFHFLLYFLGVETWSLYLHKIITSVNANQTHLCCDGLQMNFVSLAKK